MESKMELDEADNAALESLNHKQEHLRAAVLGLVKGFDTGLFVFGEGGTGKSYIIGERLESLKAQFIVHNSRITARGLVDKLEQHPNLIHWIEDAETLMDDKKSFGVLRSACWSQDGGRPMKRLITWAAHKTEIRFVFTGGILVVSNANLVNNIPEIRAIKTRIRVMRMDLANPEILALMKTICQKGFKLDNDQMTAEECWDVATYIMGRLSNLKRSVDLRLVSLGFKDYLLERTHKQETALTWQQLLESRMAETPTPYKSRAHTVAEESAVALDIHKSNATQAEKVDVWKTKTGKGKAAYYRALARG